MEVKKGIFRGYTDITHLHKEVQEHWFKEFEDFWEGNKYVKYLEHKTDSYKNNKRKLAIYNKGYIMPLIPYEEKRPNGIVYGLQRMYNKLKEIDNETLNKYYKTVSKEDFFFKEIDNIPI